MMWSSSSTICLSFPIAALSPMQSKYGQLAEALLTTLHLKGHPTLSNGPLRSWCSPKAFSKPSLPPGLSCSPIALHYRVISDRVSRCVGQTGGSYIATHLSSLHCFQHIQSTAPGRNQRRPATLEHPSRANVPMAFDNDEVVASLADRLFLDSSGRRRKICGIVLQCRCVVLFCTLAFTNARARV
ncbi:hypothetical protein BV22DRAFT_326081 [Leucogyrophana mollusca]|uniref:Uncharacterized protein n=1 Tax=Leucogyrophana mollusca TaxID=85980 RepID=A0ACB8BNT0_9AGAM|nr:hypothetical protein BV22DRAFT_326081 [Leucogyrophana mollusca]